MFISIKGQSHVKSGVAAATDRCRDAPIDFLALAGVHVAAIRANPLQIARKTGSNLDSRGLPVRLGHKNGGKNGRWAGAWEEGEATTRLSGVRGTGTASPGGNSAADEDSVHLFGHFVKWRKAPAVGNFPRPTK